MNQDYAHINAAVYPAPPAAIETWRDGDRLWFRAHRADRYPRRFYYGWVETARLVYQDQFREAVEHEFDGALGMYAFCEPYGWDDA